MSERIVIIGAGQAGSCAAMSMRRTGFAGEIVIVGAEEQQPYERPPLSKEVLTAEEPKCPYLYPAERYVEQNISLKASFIAEGIDPKAQRVHSSSGPVGYDRLLIATGGRARQLGISGNEHVQYLRTYEDALGLRGRLRRSRRVLCVGAGVIGLEIASSARALSCDVTILEATTTVMGRCLAADDAVFVADLHRAAGVDLRLSHSILSIERVGETLRVTAADGSSQEVDCVVAGVGMTRNTELASATGIEVDNGILVDETGRTNVEGIFAAGDVTAFWHPVLQQRMRLESWYHAQNHGSLVGRVMAGDEARYEDVPRFWSDQHKVNIQVAGAPQHAKRSVVQGDRLARRYTAFHLDDDDRVVGVTAVNNPRDMRPGLDFIRKGLRWESAIAQVGQSASRVRQ